MTFETLLVESDFIFIACPLTNQTRDLFNKDVFTKMKPTSVLVNIARGGSIVLDETLTSNTKISLL